MKRSLAAALGAVLFSAASSASAAGLYFADRGVRPLARGGAFVAGADDAGSVAYNPAGLAFTGNQLLLDASWLQYSSTYQRRAIVQQRDPNTGEVVGEFEQTYARVDGTSPVIPIPTLVYADSFGQKHLNFALGAWAPYAAITSWPERVGTEPAPQRYSLITLDGSALAILGAYASWATSDKKLALGAGVEALTGFFQASLAFSACLPDRLTCAPQQPDWDAYARLRVGPIVAPSGIVGAIVAPAEIIRFGASFHLPYWVSSPATTSVRLPTASAFDGAQQDGKDGKVKFVLPWTLRLGAELRPADRTRVEAAFVYEAWSMHDSIDLSPKGMALTNVTGLPPRYVISPIQLQRGFQDSYSVRLGGEQGFGLGGYRMAARVGAMYEKSAIPREYLSVTTVDLDKVTLSVGGSLYIGKWRLDAVYARVIGMSETVGAREAAIPAVNPVRANPAPEVTRINGGTYTANANVLGVGLAYQFDQKDDKPMATARR